MKTREILKDKEIFSKPIQLKYSYTEPTIIQNERKIIDDCNIMKHFNEQQKEIDMLKTQIAQFYNNNQSFSTLPDEKQLSAEIYNNITLFASRYQLLLNANQSLIRENEMLKETIKQKQNLISEFETIFHQSKIKFSQLEQVNTNNIERIRSDSACEIKALNEENRQLKNALMEKNMLLDSFNNKIRQIEEDKKLLINKLDSVYLEKEEMDRNTQSKLNELLKENKILHIEKNRLIEDNDCLHNCVHHLEHRNDYKNYELEQNNERYKSMEKSYMNQLYTLNNKLREKEIQYDRLQFDINKGHKRSNTLNSINQ